MKFFLSHAELSRIGGQTSKPTIFLAPGQVSLYVDRSPSIIVFLNSKRQIVRIIKSWRDLLNKLHVLQGESSQMDKGITKAFTQLFFGWAGASSAGDSSRQQTCASRKLEAGSRKPEAGSEREHSESGLIPMAAVRSLLKSISSQNVNTGS